MGKKKKNKLDLAEQIYDQYLDSADPDMLHPLIDNFDRITNSDNGCRLSYREYFGYGGNFYYRVIPKFLQKYDKSIKKYRRKLMKYEFGNKGGIGGYSFNEKMYELPKYVVEPGYYIVQFDDSNYCIYFNKFDENDNMVIITNLYFIGDKWKKYKDKFLNMSEKYRKLSEENHIEIIMSNRGSTDVKFKSFDKFIMTDKDKVLKYIDNWVDNIPKYHDEYDMIPKLSILLYGVPGTGKSTFYKSLAKYLNIRNVQLVDKNYLTNKSVKAYEPTIFAIDDIDCMCDSRANSKSNENNQTLSALLEFLDNPPTLTFEHKNGKTYLVQIVVATTNFYDKLDPAVRRYGRFDLQLEMGEFNAKLAQQMCDLYGLKLSKVVSDSHKKNFKISPAKLQALCMNSIDSKIKTGDDDVIDGLIKMHRIK